MTNERTADPRTGQYLGISIRTTEHRTTYNIDLSVHFKHLELIDVPGVVAATKEKWANRTLTQVNESVVRLGMLEGEFHWHKHDDDDEFFFVLEGQLLIDLEDRTIEMNPQQGVTITKGVMPRPRAPKKTVATTVETSGTKPRGDSHEILIATSQAL